MTTESRIATTTVRSGLGSDKQHGAVVSPLHLSSNFQFEGFDRKREYDYSRSGNPSRDELSTLLATLEKGAGGVVTSSGMAALNLAFQLLKPEDLLLAPHDCYGGTHRLLIALSESGRFRLQFVDQSNTDELEKAFAKNTAMVLCETPSNPLLRITDLSLVSRLCQKHGALMVCDNTFLSPGWQNPIQWGADIVVHSTTKYINGHSDVVGGAVIAATHELHERLTWWANCTGSTGAPFDSFLTLRGLRTLHPRLRLHEENAVAIARFLNQHEGVEQVYYPGLKSHPGHDIATQQQSGYGAMISFELAKNGNSTKHFVESLEYFFLAESLGGVESLVAHPATMTHSSMDAAARATAGISDRLIRLSIGIEDVSDLISDLDQALTQTPAKNVASCEVRQTANPLSTTFDYQST